MKIALSLLSAAVAVTAAQPHHHAHQHAHAEKRMPDPAAELVVVPGPTEIAYVLNGQPISAADVQEGLRNGTLQFINGQGLAPGPAAPESTPAYVAPSTSSSVWVAPTSSSAPAQKWAPPAWSPPSEPSPSSQAASWSAPSSSAPSPPVAPSSAPSSGSGSSWEGSGSGVDADFPSGTVDCGTFPSQYGAVAVPWMGLGGWTGIQSPGSNIGGFANINTATSGGCTEGSYCSYACPAGYQKSQWPGTQGATGQSVGGLLCQGGKLHLTNPDLSKSLCMTGAEQVTILVQNKLSSNVAVCRTDYPGTEGETVPLDAQPGTTSNLTCPDANNYYNWEGKHTSAQYYVNPEGVSVQDACQWGSSGNPWGNFAPLNLGVGYSNGAAWLSIFQNAPTTDATLDFAVEIVGDGVVGTCKYSNGQYCGGANYDECSSTTGCTVSLSSGTATYVFSDS